MVDLRREVANRLRAALHGREIDMVEELKPRLPHMLGITPLGNVHDPKNEQMTLLDPQHHFWEDYEEDIQTKRSCREKIQTAIHSLKEDDLFRMTYPYGEEAEVVYVEVDRPTIHRRPQEIQTSCAECDSDIAAEPNLLLRSGSYYLRFSLDCPDCEFSRVVQHPLHRQ